MESVTYRISHVTTYTYETPVRVSHNLLMLTPRQDWVVRPVNHRVAIRPQPAMINRRDDYFGNSLHAFSIEESHRQLSVAASGRVIVAYEDLPPASQTPTWEAVRDAIHQQSDPRWLEACQFRFNSPRVRVVQEFGDYAEQSFRRERPVLEAAIELSERIHADFRYDAKATVVDTLPEEAFRMRGGVCQDFAHILIGCLRAIGLSSRYVSGYLRTTPIAGQPRLIGADQSHAWASVYCGQQLGWVDLDPTNRTLCNTDHIPIAWGRDYSDVVPIRGVFLGGGDHQITVAVDVTPV